MPHFSLLTKNVLTTDASLHGVRTVLWKTKQKKELKPVAITGPIFNEEKKKSATKELGY